MISAVDVNYRDDRTAIAAGIVFRSFTESSYTTAYIKHIDRVEPYIPGFFYMRELPCILALLEDVKENLHVIIVDGYVNLGDRPGLGAHLRNAVGEATAIIGVAKSYFAESNAIEVLRGRSRRPLYVTSAGMAPERAALCIREMHGENRIPTLLKAVDSLTKEDKPTIRE